MSFQNKLRPSLDGSQNAGLSRTSAAKATAYCSYSHFRVGAVLLTRAGAYSSGANVENNPRPAAAARRRRPSQSNLPAFIGGAARRSGLLEHCSRYGTSNHKHKTNNYGGKIFSSIWPELS
ncbi:hypothetical protein B0T19DRAFT_404099 [Cercophora scortea]|uniref:Uncharacterized protein n=1 Tax=Cercophora scortea TaxID=314031 RepID=A0AAE0I6R4_9PEZI|nr:hypothetical protein B0T19DRAFT_404099 [Cercophora scortea]